MFKAYERYFIYSRNENGGHWFASNLDAIGFASNND